MAYGLLGSVVLVFIAACRCQFDGKYGGRFFDKEIPKDSVWRKIYPFKESETNPLLYVKLIPFFITFIILIAVLIIYIVYWISPPLLEEFLLSKLCAWISVSYFVIDFICYIVMIN